MKIELLKRDGSWTVVDFDFEQRDKEDWNATLARCGYRDRIFGYDSHDYEPTIGIWRSHNPKVPAYLMEMMFTDYCEYIFTETARQAFDLAAHWIPLVEAERSKGVAAYIQNAIARAFEAWHGHDLSTECSVCDGAAMQLRRELRAARPK